MDVSFLSPSYLDNGSYCSTLARDGIEPGTLSAALACVQEAKQWVDTGSFEIVNSTTLLPKDPSEYLPLTRSKLAIKYAIHNNRFAIVELREVGYCVVYGYTKGEVLVCHPSEKSYGNHGKKQILWSEFLSKMTGGWSV